MLPSLVDSLLLTEAARPTTKRATGADAINVLKNRWNEHCLGDGDPARFAGSSNLEMLDEMAARTEIWARGHPMILAQAWSQWLVVRLVSMSQVLPT